MISSDICNISSFHVCFILELNEDYDLVTWLQYSLWCNDHISGVIAPIYSTGVILWGGAWLGNHCYSTVAAHKNPLH